MTEARDNRIAELTAEIEQFERQIAQIHELARPLRDERKRLKTEKASESSKPAREAEVAARREARKAETIRKRARLQEFLSMSPLDRCAALINEFWFVDQSDFGSYAQRRRWHDEWIREVLPAVLKDGHASPKVRAQAVFHAKHAGFPLPSTVDVRGMSPEIIGRLKRLYEVNGIEINMQEAA